MNYFSLFFLIFAQCCQQELEFNNGGYLEIFGLQSINCIIQIQNSNPGIVFIEIGMKYYNMDFAIFSTQQFELSLEELNQNYPSMKVFSNTASQLQKQIPFLYLFKHTIEIILHNLICLSHFFPDAFEMNQEKFDILRSFNYSSLQFDKLFVRFQDGIAFLGYDCCLKAIEFNFNQLTPQIIQFDNIQYFLLISRNLITFKKLKQKFIIINLQHYKFVKFSKLTLIVNTISIMQRKTILCILQSNMQTSFKNKKEKQTEFKVEQQQLEEKKINLEQEEKKLNQEKLKQRQQRMNINKEHENQQQAEQNFQQEKLQIKNEEIKFDNEKVNFFVKLKLHMETNIEQEEKLTKKQQQYEQEAKAQQKKQQSKAILDYFLKNKLVINLQVHQALMLFIWRLKQQSFSFVLCYWQQFVCKLEKTKQQIIEEFELKCLLCDQRLRDGTLLQYTKCNHGFHKECLKIILNSQCSNCKNDCEKCKFII